MMATDETDIKNMFYCPDLQCRQRLTLKHYANLHECRFCGQAWYSYQLLQDHSETNSFSNGGFVFQ